MKNIKSLDGLRGIAVLMVIFFHFPLKEFQLEFGWLGVNLFFILSGFLITSILLNRKSVSLKQYLKFFYAKRVLRIFPLYYGYLIISFAGLMLINEYLILDNILIEQGITDFKSNATFLFIYLYNFEDILNHLLGRSYENSYFYGHLWSMSVESQFYLVFPFLVYFFSNKKLIKCFATIILLAPILRLLLVIILRNYISDLFWIGKVLYSNSFLQADSVCMGALLAIFYSKTHQIKIKSVYIICSLVIVIATGLCNLIYSRSVGYPLQFTSLGFDAPVFHPLSNTPSWMFNNRYLYIIPIFNLFFVLVTLLAVYKTASIKFLEFRWLVFIGKISYGLYIYHLAFSVTFLYIVKHTIGIDVNNTSIFIKILLLFIYLFVLFILAFLSYNYFELRFLKMKKRYN